ncbi:MAG TPA: TadE family protein [Acidimicrobiales bacterium]|nr:TadE family protein [Acidimicrobiales bacterium]
MLEFAFVGVFLVMLAFGIIVFGLLLSFKQDVTRAAAEGARVGAVAQPPAAAPATAADDNRYDVTLAATEDAVDSFGKTCGSGGMTCDVIIHDCNAAPVAGSVTYWDNGSDDCVTVELRYDYANNPLIIDPPMLSGALPETISSKSVARLNQ